MPRLLIVAGWALAVVDRRSADELAHRFGNDESTDGESQRRALGLARAVQAGTLLASQRPVPPELSELQPLLAAHGALATGRHAAATALREVLRELYPAALRAYPDPADPVALAVMDALPEPGAVMERVGEVGGGRGTDSVAGRLASTGLADQAAVADAVNALRVAVTETSRRGGVAAGFGVTVAETVRQAVAAVRACDAASTALVGALVNRVTVVANAATDAGQTRYATARAGSELSGSRHATPDAAAGRPVRDPALPTRQPRQSPPQEREGAGLGAGATHRWSTEPPQAAEPIPVRGGTAPAPAAAALPHNRPVSPPPPPPPGITPIPPRQPTRAGLGDQAVRVPVPRPAPDRPPLGSRSDWPTSAPPDDEWAPTPHPPPRPPTHLQDPLQSDPLQNGALPRRQARADSGGVAPGGGGGRAVEPPWRADDLRPPEPPPLHLGLPDDGLGEPTLPDAGSGRLDRSAPSYRVDHESGQVANLHDPTRREPGRDGAGRDEGLPYRRSDDALSGGMPYRTPFQADPDPPYRVDREPGRESTYPNNLEGNRANAQGHEYLGGNPGPELPHRADPLGDLPGDYGANAAYPPGYELGNGAPRSAPPVAADDDDTLLIFREIRSAWFNHDPAATWNSAMDLGWQAAEQAARPTVGDRTGAGLPRRVPHANLVPGAPPRIEHQPLRVVRDPAAIAAHTNGYFSGWRRGQQVGGFPLGSRNGPQAGAWEFDRDENRMLG